MMNAGKLVWSKQRNGGWGTSSLAERRVMYFVTKEDLPGVWTVAKWTYSDRGATPITDAVRTRLGFAKKFADAKRHADEDHHEAIRNATEENAEVGSLASLKSYIERYPL